MIDKNDRRELEIQFEKALGRQAPATSNNVLLVNQIIEQSEWKIDYESNISDLSKYGIANAPGRRMSPRTQGFVFTILDFCTNFLYKIR